MAAHAVPRVALVHDYLTQRGGAERVVVSLVRAFPGAPVFTSVYEPDRTFSELRSADIRTARVNRVRLLRVHHRSLFPVLASTFGHMNVDAAVTVASSSGWAHGVKTSGRKIVYCYTPARWLYQGERYLRHRGIPSRVAVAVGGAALRRWDRRAALSADRYVVVSRAIRDRVRSLYGIDAEVLPPPHTVPTNAPRIALRGIEPGFLLSVARLLPYKNVDAVVEAMRALPAHRLVVVGCGPEEQRLRRAAPTNVTFVGAVSDEELRWLYAESCGVVAAGYEDFGLTVVEAFAFGRPVAALRWGGYLETVRDGETGVFFDDPTPSQIGAAVRRMVADRWDCDTLLSSAAGFGESTFRHRLRSIVADEARLL